MAIDYERLKQSLDADCAKLTSEHPPLAVAVGYWKGYPQFFECYGFALLRQMVLHQDPSGLSTRRTRPLRMLS